MTTLSERAEILQKRGIRVLSLAEEKMASEFTLATYGITDEDVRDINLDQRDPEKDDILWEKPYDGLHPLACEAVKKKLLQTAAALVRHNDRELTERECRKAVARRLGVSQSTLYRKYGRLALSAACKEPVYKEPPAFTQPSQQEAEDHRRPARKTTRPNWRQQTGLS